MLLGIDVGGTFTDAVLLDNECAAINGVAQVLAQAKVPTTHEDVLQCLLAALDAVLPQVEAAASKIERVVISSTIVTNALTENKLEPVFLAVITGPGMNIKGHVPVTPYYLTGYVDHRGKITAQIDWTKHRDLLNKKGSGVCAVSGKFAVRDPACLALKLQLLLLQIRQLRVPNTMLLRKSASRLLNILNRKSLQTFQK